MMNDEYNKPWKGDGNSYSSFIIHHLSFIIRHLSFIIRYATIYHQI